MIFFSKSGYLDMMVKVNCQNKRNHELRMSNKIYKKRYTCQVYIFAAIITFILAYAAEVIEISVTNTWKNLFF